MARFELGDGGVGLGWQEREGVLHPALSLNLFGAWGRFFCLSFVFPYGGWGPDYDRQGRSGARETVI